MATRAAPYVNIMYSKVRAGFIHSGGPGDTLTKPGEMAVRSVFGRRGQQARRGKEIWMCKYATKERNRRFGTVKRRNESLYVSPLVIAELWDF